MTELRESIKGEIRAFVPNFILTIEMYRDKGISEADTKVKLIDPLFEKLGWDIRGEEVVRAHTIRPNWKPVDYLFKIEGEPRLLIETKKLDDPITLDDAKRVIEYGNTMGINWCVLTNVNELKLYNSMWPESVEKQLFFELFLTSLREDFDTKFDSFFETIWLVSRESIVSGELDKEGAREYAKRVVLEIWAEERTVGFICERAKFKKISETLTRQAIKELEIKQLFPFPSKPPEEIVPEVVTPMEEITVPFTQEAVTPPEEVITPPVEEVITPPVEEVIAPPPEEIIPSTQDRIEELTAYIRNEPVRKAFEITRNTIKKLGRDVVEEAHAKSVIYKVKDKVLVKLKLYKNYFQIDILNPPTGRYLSFDIEKGNLDRLKDRLDKTKQIYKEIRKK